MVYEKEEVEPIEFIIPSVLIKTATKKKKEESTHETLQELL
jgi:hypothetical protein